MGNEVGSICAERFSLLSLKSRPRNDSNKIWIVLVLMAAAAKNSSFE